VTAVLDTPRFTLDEWSRIVIDPIRDHAYLSTQLGKAVADYLSWKRNEDGAAERTIDSYERVLSQLALIATQAGVRGVDELTIDHLRQVRDLRPEKSRHLVTAVYKDFCTWLYQEARTVTNVAGRLRYPRRPKTAITGLFTDDEKAAIVTAQDTIRDRVCVLLLLRAGIRKGELRHLQVRDLDLRERLILVRRGKGSKARRVPVRGSLVQALDEFLLTDIPGLDRMPEPDDYLLYPARAANQHARGAGPNPKKPMAESTAHRWWYQCLERAGVVDQGVSSGRKMHSTRHTYATDLGRATGWNMLAVQKNLGHSKLGTTVDIYTQFSFEDQEAAVDLLPEIGA
jgi:site-specific recombinase XerC